MKNATREWPRLILISTSLLAASASGAAAQSPPDPRPSIEPRNVSWQLEAGRDTVALRDVARTGRPVDASPVAWSGNGPTLVLRHIRPSGKHTHRFELAATKASRFVLKTPIESLPRPKGDAFSHVEARYEYRRYLFSNLLVRGLDIGGGVQGGGTRAHRTQHVDADLEVSESRMAFRTALVIAARFQRGSRLGLAVDWANGGHIDRASERHTADPASKVTRSAGGWLTDLVVAADIAVSPHAAIAVQYRRSDEGLLSSHRNFTTARRSGTLGVIYAK